MTNLTEVQSNLTALLKYSMTFKALRCQVHFTAATKSFDWSVWPCERKEVA